MKEPEEIAAAILSAAKYRDLSPALVRRVAQEAGRRGDAEKSARRRLHQLYGAFLTGPIRGLDREVDALVAVGPEERRTRCLSILSRHASTSERIACMEELYGAVRSFLGPAPARVLDLGAGLAPFALPWMGLDRSTWYHAVDVDTATAAAARRWLTAAGQAGTAEALDLLSQPCPPGPWDGVLMLKLVPTLERQRAGAAAELVRSLGARRYVISYARASLGGRRKGMDSSYERMQTDLAALCKLTCSPLVLPTEVVWLCTGGGPG